MKITKRQLKRLIKEGEMSQIVADEPHEDDMTAGEYYASRRMGLAYNSSTADELDLFSAAIRDAREAGVSPKDVLAFVQQVLGDAQSDEIIDVRENRMKITKARLKQIIKEEVMNEGIWDTIKGAVGMGMSPEDAGMEVQEIFERMGNGVGAMMRLQKKGSQMGKHWNSYTGNEKPEALSRGSIPSGYYRSQNKTGFGNILFSIGKFKDHWHDSMWNHLAGAAPDANTELEKIFSALASRPQSAVARKLRDIGIKIKDEALSTGDEDELVEFLKVLKSWVGEDLNQASFDANAWFEQYIADKINEGRRVTKRQLKRIIREAMVTRGTPFSSSPDHRSMTSAEYDRGYQDGLDQFPIADDATADYDVGYEDGILDAQLPDMGPAPTPKEEAEEEMRYAGGRPWEHN